MRTITYLLFLFLLVAAYSCGEKEKEYNMANSFWPPIEKESDSLVALINERINRIDFNPTDTLIADRIYAIGVRTKNDQIKIRGEFFRIVALSRRSMNDENISRLKEIINRCDTVRYKYDLMRFKTFAPRRIYKPVECGKVWLEGMDVFKEAGDSLWYANCTGCYGITLQAFGDTTQTYPYLHKAGRIYKSIKAYEQDVTNSYNIATNYYLKRNYKKAANIIDTLRTNPMFLLHNNIVQGADIMYYEKTHDKKLLFDALQRCDSAGNPKPFRPSLYAMIAAHYVSENNRDSVKYYKNLAMANRELWPKNNSSIYQSLARVYEYENNRDSAALCLEKVKDLDEAMKSRIQSAALENASNLEELKAIEHQMSRMSGRNTRDKSIIVVLILITIGMIGCGLLIFRYMKSHHKDILKQEKRRTALTQIKMKERERALAEIAESVKENKDDVQKVIARINAGLTPNSDWQRVELLFAEINPEFVNKLRKSFPSLSPAEHRMACLIYLGLDNKQIARLLSITPESVKKTRYRLRTKLPIGSKDNLQEFLNSLV